METMKKSASHLLVSKGWIQAVVIVVVFGFFVLGLLAYRTYRDEPPIPVRTVGAAGEVLFTHQDVVDGQGVFLRNGLMEYGSIFGHGAYLGPDFTADYLHRAALLVIDEYVGPSSDRARARTIADFSSNRYAPENGRLTFSAAQAEAFGKLETCNSVLRKKDLRAHPSLISGRSCFLPQSASGIFSAPVFSGS
jgi:nitric oxide reductase subunit B